ncbi:MAG: serine/threonine protein kinase [Synechococcaceae cyanobacterium]
MNDTAIAPGQTIGERYRLERLLSPASSSRQGDLWLARDQLAGEAPAVLRRVGPGLDQERARQIWSRLQGVLHPQIPRFGAEILEADQLWLARDWQNGRTFQELLEARRERQLVFGAGEVLLLLRQLLPLLVALHGQGLVHGDLCPANLLRRDSDGLPVLLDFGLARLQADEAPAERAGPEAAGPPLAATPGYAPPELLRGEPVQAWMDLYALGVVALVLLSGDDPGALVDPVGLAWRWPAALEQEPGLQAQLARLVSTDPRRRFRNVSQALQALQELPMPDSTGPVPRADRTLALLPPEVSPAEAAALRGREAAAPEAGADAPSAGAAVASAAVAGAAVAEAGAADQAGAAETAVARQTAASEADGPAAGATGGSEAAAALEEDGEEWSPQARPAYLEREEAAEGGLWPVLIALVLSAIAGTALGWWWLGRDQAPQPPPQFSGLQDQTASLPPSEVDQRQQLLNRLRALQVDRGWFLRLVDAALLAQYPEQKGRLPSASAEDAPLRKVWNELADDWLARVEQLPLTIRGRLGRLGPDDWERSRKTLLDQGISAAVLEQLVSGNAQNLLPGSAGRGMPPEPFRQLWYAAAEQTLSGLRVDPIVASSGVAQIVSADVPANGVRLFPIKLPLGHSLALGVNGTPLVQMAVFDATGKPLEAKGPLRVVTVPGQSLSPLQLLVSNEGVAPALIRLSLRADPPPAVPAPSSDPASGALIVPLEPQPNPGASPSGGEQPGDPEAGGAVLPPAPAPAASAPSPTAPASPAAPPSPPPPVPPSGGAAGRAP